MSQMPMSQLLTGWKEDRVTASMSFLICPLEITIRAVQWPWLLSVITLHYTNKLKLTGQLLERGIKQPSLDTPARDYTTNV